MRARGSNGAAPPGIPDREVWRRSQQVDAPPDEAEYLLDLAAYAENRLDDDDEARLVALIARDPDAAADVAAARALAGVAPIASTPDVVARAAALVDVRRPEGQLIAFPGRPVARPWYSAATWSGLAAAIVMAGWLGFDLGNGLSNAPPFGRAPDEASTSELLDPAPLLLRDFTESSQI